MTPLLLCALLATEARAAQAPKTSVVLVVVDALRPDHLGAYGYRRATSPRLDALAAGGAVFTQAITQAPWTLPALSSIMTSLYPSVHGATALPPDPDWVNKLDAGVYSPDGDQRLSDRWPTLAEALRAAGRRTIGVVSGGLCRSAFGFGRGFDEYHDLGGPLVTLNKVILPWLAAHRAEPFFLYVHAADAHLPYGGPPEFQRKFDAEYSGWLDGSRDSLRKLDALPRPLPPSELEHLRALYDGGIAYADSQLGELFDALDRLGLSTTTLVVVTADHGEEFAEHGGLTHGDTLYDEVLRVPLILRGPGVPKGRRVSGQVRSIDIAPTILSLAGAARPPQMQGASLVPWLEGARADDLDAFSEVGSTVALRTPRWKLLAWPGGEELFDLRRDPRELSNARGKAPEEGAALERRLADWRAGNAARREKGEKPAQVDLDPATRERLKAAGYLR